MRILAIILMTCMMSCSSSKKIAIDYDKEASAIEAVMSMQEEAWTRGDIDQFMEGYWKSDKLRFSGKSGITYGWNETKAMYKRGYPDKTSMGALTFEIFDIDFLSADAAVLIGSYRLKRQLDEPTGVFTLTWRKLEGQWYITSDMTCG